MSTLIRSRGKKVDVPADKRALVIRLRKEKGLSIAKLAKESGLSRWTVDVVLEEEGLKGEPTAKSAPQNGTRETPKAQGAVAGSARPLAKPEAKGLDLLDAMVSEDAKTAQEVAARISVMHDVADKIVDEATRVRADIAAMWERAEKIAQHEETLATALATIRTLRNRLGLTERKLAELENKNLERSIAISGEGSLVSRG